MSRTRATAIKPHECPLRPPSHPKMGDGAAAPYRSLPPSQRLPPHPHHPSSIIHHPSSIIHPAEPSALESKFKTVNFVPNPPPLPSLSTLLPAVTWQVTLPARANLEIWAATERSPTSSSRSAPSTFRIQHPETRNPKPETKNQEPRTRTKNQEPRTSPPTTANDHANQPPTVANFPQNPLPSPDPPHVACPLHQVRPPTSCAKRDFQRQDVRAVFSALHEAGRRH